MLITIVGKVEIKLLLHFRNGANLGDAFSDIKLGPGMAYFPAVSLSLGENLRANFGATPLRYPLTLIGILTIFHGVRNFVKVWEFK